MRINVGIRRRLAPLMDNGRRQIELMNALLMSMPGTPIIYYGDEIGMGDNIYLGDRNGVRTPMQWSADRNAGFSERGQRGALLPADRRSAVRLPDGERRGAGAHADVAAALDARHRRGAPAATARSAAARASRSTPENRRVLVFLRRYEDEMILCVNNLSRFAQYVELDLREFDGWSPIELWSGQAFPPIGELPYLLTLNGRDFLWFRLDAARWPAAARRDRAGGRVTHPPMLDSSTESDAVRAHGWQLQRGATVAPAASRSASGRRPRARSCVHVATGAARGDHPLTRAGRRARRAGRRRCRRARRRSLRLPHRRRAIRFPIR